MPGGLEVGLGTREPSLRMRLASRLREGMTALDFLSGPYEVQTVTLWVLFCSASPGWVRVPL